VPDTLRPITCLGSQIGRGVSYFRGHAYDPRCIVTMFLERYKELVTSGLDLISFLLVTPELIRIVRPTFVYVTLGFLYFLISITVMSSLIYVSDYWMGLFGISTRSGFWTFMIYIFPLACIAVFFHYARRKRRSLYHCLAGAIRVLARSHTVSHVPYNSIHCRDT